MTTKKLLTLPLLLSFGCIAPVDMPDARVAPPDPEIAGVQEPVKIEPVKTEPVPAAIEAPTKPMLTGARTQPKEALRKMPLAPKRTPDWMQTSQLFASTELGPVEANLPAQGAAHFYGAPKDAMMHLRISGLIPGQYGAYIGKDCKPAAALHDSNPFDRQGVGSVTVRPNELKVGVLRVDGSGVGELDAAIVISSPDGGLINRAIILMPSSAELVDQPQTKVACGMIESVRGS